MGFSRDVKIGKDGENTVQKLLESFGYLVQTNTSKKKEKLKEWDLKIEKGMLTFFIEVKKDIMAKSTGNLAVEYMNSRTGKASGLMTTKSDFWVYVLEVEHFGGFVEEIWLASAKALKEYLQCHNPVKVVDKAGDGNAALFLYKKEKILSEDGPFIRIDDKTEEEIFTLFKLYDLFDRNEEIKQSYTIPNVEEFHA